MVKRNRAAIGDTGNTPASNTPRKTGVSRGRAAHKKTAPAQEAQEENERAARVDCPRDKEAEKQRFYAILKDSGSAYLYGKKVYVKIAHAGGKDSPYPITAIDTRAWAFALYASAHKEAARPLIESYKAACDELLSSLLVASDGSGSGNDSEDWEARIEQVRMFALLVMPTSDLQAEFACVPYMKDNHDLSLAITGIWRLAGRRSTRLVDMYIEVERIAVPLATSRGKDVHYTLRCVNAQGIERAFIDIPRDEIEDKGLDAKLVGYASWPILPMKRYYLLEALGVLAKLSHVKRQEEADSLGWQTSNEHGLVWQCANGIETRAGFIPAQDAPFLPPTILTPGNGYIGTGDIPAPGSDIWNALLDVLNTSNSPRIYGKLGAYMRVLLPPGCVEHEPIERAGKLPFPIETIGLPRHGKSSEDNFILSLYGTGFQYNRETFLQERNTIVGRLGLQSKVRYCLYTDYDHKASETSKDFEKQHNARHNEITYYADGSDGGTVGKKDGGHRSRGNPTGGILITGNHEHTPYSIANGETADELRLMTFVWKQGDRSNDDVSREINARRREIYTWGVASRKWIMERYAQDKEAFTLLVTQCYREATDTVISDSYAWAGCDLHRNQAIDCVAMGRLWQRFLQECYPDCYLLIWLEIMEAAFIEDRLERCQYVSKLDAGHKDEQNIIDFALETIRTSMGASGLYLLSQQGKTLADGNTPAPLTRYGYRLVTRLIDGVATDVYDTGATQGGYYLKASNAIAFIPDAFYRALSMEAARKKVTLLPRAELFKQLVDADIVKPTLKNREYKRYEQGVKIGSSVMWLVIIPHDVLFPPAQLEDGETYINEDGRDIPHYEVSQDEAQESNVIAFPGKRDTPAPASLQGELAVNGNEPGAENSHEPYDPFTEMEIEDIPEYEPVS